MIEYRAAHDTVSRVVRESPARMGVRAMLRELIELFKAIAMVYKYRAEMYKALADYNRSKKG